MHCGELLIQSSIRLQRYSQQSRSVTRSKTASPSLDKLMKVLLHKKVRKEACKWMKGLSAKPLTIQKRSNKSVASCSSSLKSYAESSLRRWPSQPCAIIWCSMRRQRTTSPLMTTLNAQAKQFIFASAMQQAKPQIRQVWNWPCVIKEKLFIRAIKSIKLITSGASSLAGISRLLTSQTHHYPQIDVALSACQTSHHLS